MTPAFRAHPPRLPSSVPGSIRLKPNAVAIAVAALFGIMTSAAAAPLTLAQVPQGNGGREPAPNIILSVDDSGSMSWNDSPTMAGLKAALNSAFSTSAVSDDSIRLGFQAMWRCRGFGTGQSNSYGGACPENRVRPFSGTHRAGFNNWVNSLTPYSNTPSHLMIKNAGEFMKTTGIWNPFAKVPGTTETPLLACRKSFHIFMTDGEWNSEFSYGNDPTTAGNADGTNRTLPDGTPYDTSAANTQTRIYRDPYGGEVTYDRWGRASIGAATVSDFVFDYWATDLQPSIPNEVRPIIRVPGAVDHGTAGNPYMVQEYWNPRNNPATWQSLTTYTIGFGGGAALSTSGASNRPWWGGASGTTWSGGDYNDLITGVRNWGDPFNSTDARRKELWHMALNGRGRYVSAANAADLRNAFSEILNQILLDTTSPIVAVSANTQTARADTLAFVAGYSAVRWSGDLTGYGLNSSGGIDSTVVWNAAAQLDAVTPVNRKIFTQNDLLGSSLGQGTTFTWGNLGPTQQSDLRAGNMDPVAVGQNRVNYLRGDRSLEEANGGTMRTRMSRLGDIVNSAPWSVGKPNMGYLTDSYMAFRRANDARLPMVYVGANDGMLHGFAVQTAQVGGVTTLQDGAEKMAYVPRGVYPNLPSLTLPSYVHRYYVDGKPFSSDFNSSSNVGSPTWRTALVGTLAGGGKGFFVLDVTNPSAFATASAAAIADLVITDKTATFTPSTVVGQPLAATWNDMGHMYSPPTQDSSNPARVLQITKLNNNRWALLMGNGINSTNETAVLLIQYLDGDKELVKLTADATVGNGNGLSHPLVVDLNGDDKADVAYAGDIQGNLWKFDLSSATPSNWNVAFNGNPLFVARGYPAANAPGSSGERQPITTSPTWAFHPVRGLSLVFGTGRDITSTDPASTAVQTIYSVWDNTTINLSTTGVTFGNDGTRVADSASGGRASLLQRTQTAETTTAKGRFMTTSTNTEVDYTGANAKRGWFFNLPDPGERVIANPKVLDKRLVAVPSIRPTLGSQTQSSDESCEPSATPAANYITILDAVTGKPYAKRPFFDTNGDGLYSSGDLNNASRVSTGKDPMLFIPVKSNTPFETGFRLVSSRPGGGAGTEPDKNAAVLDDPARVNWRQLQ